jgi:hypothetical protein
VLKGLQFGYVLVVSACFDRINLELTMLDIILGLQAELMRYARKPNPAPASYSTDQVGPENSGIELFSAWLHP